MPTLKELRQAKGLSVRQLSNLIGVSRQTICHYEADKCMPPEDIWVKLVDALGLEGIKREDLFRPRRPSRKYFEGKDKCSAPGCDKVPVSNGLCVNHYVTSWRRKKRAAERLARTAPASTTPAPTQSDP